jgi:hypothetical protein
VFLELCDKLEISRGIGAQCRNGTNHSNHIEHLNHLSV